MIGDAYEPAPDLGVVTAYFAPRPSTARLARFHRFVAPFREGGLTLRIVELVLDGHAPELPDAPDVVRVRARHVLWHKERLLSHAIQALPATCTKVAWVDADILFYDPTWAVATSHALDRAAVAQPFSRVIQEQRPGHEKPPGLVDSYAAVLARDPRAHREGVFDRHGHTGYAWAAKREIIQTHGLYTACIAGGADHAMAHAFTGDIESACLDRVLGLGPHRAHFTRWATAIHTSTSGQIAAVPGDITHLWHGDLIERRYVERYERLREFSFDPTRDLSDEGDAWALSHDANPALRAWLSAYFGSRTNDLRKKKPTAKTPRPPREWA